MNVDIYSKGNLIKLFDLDQDFIIDLKYATPDNFTGEKIYRSAECYMDRHTAEILIKARDIFKKDRYRVKIWDAYRPISAQAKFWEVMPDDNFVARPPDMSKIKVFRPTHMNGLCVDVTLTDMDGNDIEMPTYFDDMSERAALGYVGHTEEGRKNGTYLKDVMESVGFQAYEGEWWHFYDVTTEPTPFMDYQI
ncbi:MAG: M15 family metallopeptidase [Firmicutes bacterium]|nr:M15 family metallopeptidase [Bacillota bacterium]